MIEIRKNEEEEVFAICPCCGRKLRGKDIRTIRHYSEKYAVEVCSLCGRELVIYPLA
jgi:ssDNA-binding Zn-finger/Zn-ribbon topoisomerase 1